MVPEASTASMPRVTGTHFVDLRRDGRVGLGHAVDRALLLARGGVPGVAHRGRLPVTLPGAALRVRAADLERAPRLFGVEARDLRGVLGVGPVGVVGGEADLGHVDVTVEAGHERDRLAVRDVGGIVGRALLDPDDRGRTGGAAAIPPVRRDEVPTAGVHRPLHESSYIPGARPIAPRPANSVGVPGSDVSRVVCPDRSHRRPPLACVTSFQQTVPERAGCDGLNLPLRRGAVVVERTSPSPEHPGRQHHPGGITSRNRRPSRCRGMTRSGHRPAPKGAPPGRSDCRRAARIPGPRPQFPSLPSGRCPSHPPFDVETHVGLPPGPPCLRRYGTCSNSSPRGRGRCREQVRVHDDGAISELAIANPASLTRRGRARHSLRVQSGGSPDRVDHVSRGHGQDVEVATVREVEPRALSGAIQVQGVVADGEQAVAGAVVDMGPARPADLLVRIVGESERHAWHRSRGVGRLCQPGCRPSGQGQWPPRRPVCALPRLPCARMHASHDSSSGIDDRRGHDHDTTRLPSNSLVKTNKARLATRDMPTQLVRGFGECASQPGLAHRPGPTRVEEGRTSVHVLRDTGRSGWHQARGRTGVREAVRMSDVACALPLRYTPTRSCVDRVHSGAPMRQRGPTALEPHAGPVLQSSVISTHSPLDKFDQQHSTRRVPLPMPAMAAATVPVSAATVVEVSAWWCPRSRPPATAAVSVWATYRYVSSRMTGSGRDTASCPARIRT